MNIISFLLLPFDTGREEDKKLNPFYVTPFFKANSLKSFIFVVLYEFPDE